MVYGFAMLISLQPASCPLLSSTLRSSATKSMGSLGRQVPIERYPAVLPLATPIGLTSRSLPTSCLVDFSLLQGSASTNRVRRHPHLGRYAQEGWQRIKFFSPNEVHHGQARCVFGALRCGVVLVCDRACFCTGGCETAVMHKENPCMLRVTVVMRRELIGGYVRPKSSKYHPYDYFRNTLEQTICCRMQCISLRRSKSVTAVTEGCPMLPPRFFLSS